MSNKAVDLGPMSLPVGDDAVDSVSVFVARQSDVQRLKQLLADGGKRQSENSFPDPEKSVDPLIHPSDMVVAETDALIQLAEALPNMVQPTASSAVRTVQLQLNEKLLPDTTLTAFESAGRLHFEIRFSELSSQSWLSTKLPWLVRQVGEKLGRPIRVTLFATNANELSTASIDWPEGKKN